MHHSVTAFYQGSQPLDRLAILLILGLSALIGLLLWSGDRTAPRVRDFSWLDKQVGAADTAFILTFNRPMDPASVQANLRIAPPLPGKVSWAGRRMAYTLTEPVPYGTTFQVRLKGAQDRSQESNRALLQPFLGRFATRDRAFVYLGVAGAETGRLMLYNLTRQQKMTLTPANLIIDEYEPYPEGDRILFSATERADSKGLFQEFDPKLYTVSTGIHYNLPSQQGQKKGNQAAGEIKLVLDNTDYKIHQFDLAADGQKIVVELINKRQIAQPSLWVLQPDFPPEMLDIRPGAGFTITPDSHSLLVDLGRGLTIFPLKPEKVFDPIFLPEFGRVLSFARDGSVAAMVKVNSDDSLSLFRVTAAGGQKELLRTMGSIYSAQLSPSKQTLYCLLTQTPSGANYQEQHPYLAAINLQTGKLTPLATLPQLAAIDLQTGKLTNSVNVSSRQDWQISLAPDGLSLLYTQTNSVIQSARDMEINPASNLWLLPLPLHNPSQPALESSATLPQRGSRPSPLPIHSPWQSLSKSSAGATPPLAQPQPEALPLAGFHPLWLP